MDLLHTNKMLPYNYFEETACQFISCYKKIFTVPKEWEGKMVLLESEGVVLACEIFCNGKPAGGHEGGFTPFWTDLTNLIKYGEENVVTVKVDSREREDIPPYGNVVDYLTYGGIYREVWLIAADPVRFTQMYLDCQDPMEEVKTLRCSCEVAAEKTCKATLTVTLLTPDGFFLNGKKVKLIGLNRHQSWPYSGYAMPRRIQKKDAELLRNELGCNMVRTSHYPQSRHFLDACDELGARHGGNSGMAAYWG